MSGMLDVTHQSDKPQDYKGQVFIGKVVVNDDIKMFHRIKVEIPDMWDEYKQEELPWCIPAMLPGGCGPTEYSQNIPETGSFVYVIFQNGDNHLPMYYGGVRDYNTVVSVLHENYPHRVGWELNSFTEEHANDERHRVHVVKGDPVPYPRYIHHFFVDRMTNEVEYKHPTETKINIADNGRIFLEVRARDLPDGGDFITHTDRHYELEVSNAKFDGDPGHYLCKVLEDWWETYAQTHIRLESKTDRIDIKAPKTIRIESTEIDVEVIAAGNVKVTAGGNITANAEGNITAVAVGDVTVQSGGNMIAASGGSLSATAAAAVDIGAPDIRLSANLVTIAGNLLVNGDIEATGTITP